MTRLAFLLCFAVALSAAPGHAAMGGIPDTLARSIQYAAQLGQQLYGHLTPDGWPDVADAWMNTGAVLNRINFGANVAAGRIVGIAVNKWPPAMTLKGVAQATMADSVAAVLLQGEMSPDTHAVLMSGTNPIAERAGQSAMVAKGAPSLAELIGLALGAPEFQRH